MPSLYHFSEDPTITHFEPRISPSYPGEVPVVWAMDAEHAPIYYFPRDCPRVTFWKLPTTSEEDKERFLGITAARIFAAIEGVWLERVRETILYRYEFPAEPFLRSQEEGFYGGYVSREAITPRSVEPVGNLLTALRDAGVELRITPSLWPLHDALLSATLHFSMIRMRNATPRNA